MKYFTEGLELATKEYYVDATQKFSKLINEFPESDLADDALYNVGLCYFRMNQFEMAIETFQQVIFNYPEAEISALQHGNESGKTAAKCYYSILMAQIALGQINKARETAIQLNQYSENTYVNVDNINKSYAELAGILFQKYEHK